MSTRPAVLSLYRRSLKLSLDWAVNRQLWRGQALYIRSLFEKNRDVHDPRHLRVLLKETEKLLDHWKHPDPFAHPLSPGGKQSFTCDQAQREVLLMKFQAQNTRETCPLTLWTLLRR
ncbi:hypothetical protein SMACR_08325 [Sordaria macrospora]|uniref:NADH dehydrogenase [ubiquinone] 1 beta subcomplex subunit 9 n=2 Tax=Sordaria macrospora TaxID=5147 RepID=F7VV79_SORMK|nr:uncharacterized protein SMAC_08325 [Sordaria macrospora k-hell]KAA8630802.1 hypothetical protein SMACR_08325 [Sordaria macrospora]WPJ65846.1 hypothetical protein SMAC4_08325 [Sordaria macrospora]CCC09420.1 unnamed protein product [Sordaria macrospora k-hell]